MILHCNSLYPAPAEIVNLPLMNTYKSMFDCPVGFSDHTDGIHIPIAAVAIGAKIIEKHFTLDKNFKTPDSTSFAADPVEFSNLVSNIREVEKALIKQKPRLEIQKEEEKFKNSILYRAVTNKNISKGSLINSLDIKYLRDNHGLNANDLFGKNDIGIAQKNLKENHLLSLGDIIKR